MEGGGAKAPPDGAPLGTGPTGRNITPKAATQPTTPVVQGTKEKDGAAGGGVQVVSVMAVPAPVQVTAAEPGAKGEGGMLGAGPAGGVSTPREGKEDESAKAALKREQNRIRNQRFRERQRQLSQGIKHGDEMDIRGLAVHDLTWTEFQEEDAPASPEQLWEEVKQAIDAPLEVFSNLPSRVSVASDGYPDAIVDAQSEDGSRKQFTIPKAGKDARTKANIARRRVHEFWTIVMRMCIGLNPDDYEVKEVHVRWSGSGAQETARYHELRSAVALTRTKWFSCMLPLGDAPVELIAWPGSHHHVRAGAIADVECPAGAPGGASAHISHAWKKYKESAPKNAPAPYQRLERATYCLGSSNVAVHDGLLVTAAAKSRFFSEEGAYVMHANIAPKDVSTTANSNVAMSRLPWMVTRSDRNNDKAEVVNLPSKRQKTS